MIELKSAMRRRVTFAPALCALAVLLLMSSDAAAERISLLGFDGDSARALRWRIAGAFKRAGHTVVGFAPPKDPDDTAQLRSFARRRKVDVFVSGSSVHGSDGWELTLTLKNAEGDALGKGVTFTAGSLREMIAEIKENGEGKLDRAISGGSGGAGRGRDSGGDVSAGLAGNTSALVKKQKGRGSDPAPKRRDVEEPINLDDDASDGAAGATGGGASEEDGTTFDADDKAAEEKPRAARAKGWAKSSDSSASEKAAASDEDKSSFSSEGSISDGESSEEVGADDSNSESDKTASASDDPTVVLGLDAGFVRRNLTYSDDIYGRLRAPSVNAWVYRLQAAVYPFARPVKTRLGLIAGYEAEFSGVVRDDNAGTDFGVNYSELYGGLKFRQPLGKHEIGIEGTFNSLRAGLDDPDGLSGVPEYSYTSLRAAANVGLQFGDLALRGGLGYRLQIGGYGEASEAEWFPRMEGSGVEGDIGASYRISKEVAFDISGSFRRFLLQMNSQPSDAMGSGAEVAGGAVDLYLGGYFGLNITL